MSESTLSIPAAEDRVLLAVEDEVSADLLIHRMTRRGIHPEQVEHGRAATQRLQETAFDLVIIETRFPGLTGLELLRHTPSEKIKGSPRIVLLGEGGNNEEIVRAFELGAAEYVQRPFAPEVALARILRFLGKGRQFVSRPASSSVLPLVPGRSIAEGVAIGGPFEWMIGITAVFIVCAVVLAVIAAATHARAEERTHRRRTKEAAWKSMLLEIMAGDREPIELMKQVEDGDERLFLEFLVPYAVTFEGQPREVLVALAEPFLIHIEEDLVEETEGQRARTVQLFGLLGDETCSGLLRKHLDDPSPIVAYASFRWLARRGPPDAAEPLLDHLDRFSHTDINRVASVLVHLGPDAVPTLCSYLSDESQPTFVRVVCAETLRWIGEAEVAPIAAQLLVYEPPPELVAALLRLLRRVGRPEHAPLVRSYFESDVPFIRIHAARALGQIGHPEDDRELLKNLVLDTGSRWVALNAARSLKELGQTSPLHELARTTHGHAALADSVLKEPVR